MYSYFYMTDTASGFCHSKSEIPEGNLEFLLQGSFEVKNPGQWQTVTAKGRVFVLVNEGDTWFLWNPAAGWWNRGQDPAEEGAVRAPYYAPDWVMDYLS